MQSYTRIAGSRDVDASLLMLPLVEWADPGGDRIRGTIDAVNRLLRHDDVVYRYHAEDGVPGGEGCFLNCSFWLVGALARCGRTAEATALMEAWRRAPTTSVCFPRRSIPTAARSSATSRRRSCTSR